MFNLVTSLNYLPCSCSNQPGGTGQHVIEEVVLSFGKHKGKLIKEVDDRYLKWMQVTLGSSGWSELAAEVLEQRKQQVPKPGSKSRNRVVLHELKACSVRKNLQRGKEIHAEVMQSGTDSCIYVATALVDMYAKCGTMVNARRVFDGIENPDVVSWTALILGYVQDGEGRTALELFARMRSRGCAPDSFTIVAALKACTSLALKQDGSGKAECLKWGKQIHSEISCHSVLHVQSALVDMYSKCGSMVDARQVFDRIKNPDVVSWTALILGYAENGEGTEALNLFAKMKSQGCAPNSFTFVAALKACISLSQEQGVSRRAECLELGKQIHSEIGWHLDIYVQSSLVDMYSKCGSMIHAREVFDSIKQPNVVQWTALILGYADNGEGVTALDLFARMRSQGCAPNSFTYSAALKACCLLGALESGRKIHAEIDAGTQGNEILVTCLVDFYAKCGSLVEAQKVFDSHPRTRTVKAWTALLAGYSRLGDMNGVFRLFQGMQDAGLKPDGATFSCILACCSHAGLVEKASQFFESMSTVYGVKPTIEHYTCMVDILGQSNKLDEAIALLRSMPCVADSVTWMAVLSACRKWKNVEIGKLAFNSLVRLDHSNAGAYVLMAHIYRSKGMLDEQQRVLGLLQRSEEQV